MRVLFFGSCPMPVERDLPAQGPGIRTWQLIKPVCDAGHKVRALCLRTEGLYPEKAGDTIISAPYQNLNVYNCSFGAYTNSQRMRALAQDFKPDAIVGAASVLPNYTAVLARDIAPVWADCFGDPITEIQAKAQVYGCERTAEELFGVWRIYRAVLVHADRFSALSDAQSHALVGQLALLGRLGFENAGCPLIHTIPCGVEEAPIASSGENLIRGKRAPADAFIVCFSGSYNTWMDADLLFEGIEAAMRRLPNLYFLSIGGGTKGYNEKLYNYFCLKVENSPFKERFLLMGWVPFEEAPRYYAESNLGINCDRFTYEGVLGSRNRIVQFLAHGLPVATTPLSEISRQLARENLVFPFAMKENTAGAENAEPLPELLARLASDTAALRQTGQAGRKFVLEQFNYERTVKPLLDWLAKPERAPDNKARAKREPVEDENGVALEPVYLNEIERAMDYEFSRRQIELLTCEKKTLDRFRANPFYKSLKFFKGLFNKK